MISEGYTVLSKLKISSGDHCTNLQVDNLAYVKSLSPQEIKEIRADITKTILAQDQKEFKIAKLGRITDDQYSLISNSNQSDKISIDPEGLISILEGWTPDKPQAQRLATLEEILSCGLYAIINNHQLAYLIIHDITCHPFIRSLITPACKISLDQHIDVTELVALVQATTNSEIMANQNLSFRCQLYLIKIVFSILYQTRTSQEDEGLEKILTGKLFNSCFLAEQFFVDAFYRTNSNYLNVTPNLAKIFNKQAKDYFKKYPKNPLAIIKRTILSPMEIYDEYRLDTVIDDLSKLALLCRNVIEARWIFSALLKLLPLYKTEDLDLDYDKYIEIIVDKFSTDILSNFHFLKYTNLRNKLYIFHMTGNQSYLGRYENAFLDYKNSLAWHQQIALQIEYASAIYIFLLNNSEEGLDSTKFYNLLKNSSSSLVENLLFANIFVVDATDLQVPANSLTKGILLKWLSSYVDRIYRFHAEKQIKNNPFLLFNYRSTSKVPKLRSRVFSIITSFINNQSSDEISENPSYANKILNLIEFTKTSREFDWKNLSNWVSSSLAGNRYDILLNARSLAYALYALKYYYDNESSSVSNKLTDEFKKISISTQKPPSLYWASAACLSLLDNEQEKDFVISLYKSLEQANRKLFQLSLRKDEHFSLVIPDKTIEMLRLKSHEGSVLALVGEDYMLVTEYWNLLATTIFNLAFPSKIESLDIASLFYSVAKCFAREQRCIDQKYSYNYIRARSLYYLGTNSQPPNGFLRDCSFYIDRPNNQFFSFKKKCCMPFFELLKKYYDDMSPDIKELYESQIMPKRYWVKKAFLRLNIGVFKSKFNIQ
jgi:hypothetical protein